MIVGINPAVYQIASNSETPDGNPFTFSCPAEQDSGDHGEWMALCILPLDTPSMALPG